jgi:ribosome-associated protein
MSRKPKRGYFVRGQFVAEGSELDQELKRELKGSEGPSKTDLKRESEALQAQGQALLTLNSAAFDALNLPDILVQALTEFKRISNFEGKRRQGQFVGKLMRKLEPDVLTAIEVALALHRQGLQHNSAQLHAAESWRDRLIESDEHVSAWMQAQPGTDSQQLRALVRQARKDLVPATGHEVAQGLAPRQSRAYRELFQLIKDHLQETQEDTAQTPAEEQP